MGLDLRSFPGALTADGYRRVRAEPQAERHAFNRDAEFADLVLLIDGGIRDLPTSCSVCGQPVVPERRTCGKRCASIAKMRAGVKGAERRWGA